MTYLSPTGQRTRLMPDSRQAISRPMLLITVATDGVSAQPAFALQLARTHQQHGIAVDDVAAMVDENRPIAVAVEGHAHVAAALDDRPRQKLRDASIRNRRLMLRPSGWFAMTTASNPRLAKSSGATVVVAPFAQSMASLKPSSAAASGNTARR